MTMDIQTPFIMEAPVVSQENRSAIQTLLEQAKAYARAPISDYQVGALVVGESGRAYLGANLEFISQPLSQTLHAEQFAVWLARLHGESAIRQIVVSALPCGHCRQFLMELGQPDIPIVVFNEDGWQEYTLAQLLPHPFSLADADSGMFCRYPASLQYTQPPQLKDLADIALEAASLAYVPYTGSYAGVAIRMEDDRIYTGSCLESAAFNPTLSAVQAALVHLVSEEAEYHQIREVVLVEREGTRDSNSGAIWGLIKSLSPLSQIEYVTASCESM